MSAVETTSVLLFRAGERTCALSVFQVLEIMRPLSVEEAVTTSPFVCGLSVIRGTPTPVVSLSSLFAGSRGLHPTRFVVVRVEQRQVALAVDEVLGVSEIESSTLHTLPSLVQDAGAGILGEIGILDAQFLFVLNAAKIMPDEVWRELAVAPLS